MMLTEEQDVPRPEGPRRSKIGFLLYDLITKNGGFHLLPHSEKLKRLISQLALAVGRISFSYSTPIIQNFFSHFPTNCRNSYTVKNPCKRLLKHNET